MKDFTEFRTCAEQELEDELGRCRWKWKQPNALILQGPEC